MIARRTLSALVGSAVLSAGCGSTSPTAPTPTTPRVEITSVAASGERRVTGGYTYRVVIQLRETAGVAATIVSVDLTFGTTGAAIRSARYESPLVDGTGVLAGGAAGATRELAMADADAAATYATTVDVVVHFTDGRSYDGAVAARAGIPPLSEEPPPPARYPLAGRITDVVTHAPIAGARLEITTGVNAGRSAVAASDGVYLLDALAADAFRLRASADGYDPGEQGVAVPENRTADFELRRTAVAACAYTVAPSGAVNVSFVAGQLTVAVTRTSGACGWQASSNAAWLTASPPAGSGSAPLTIAYASNAAFVGRSGTVTITWSGGSSQLIVAQPGESPVFCRIVTLTVGGQTAITAPAAGAQLVAAVTPEPGIPPGVCGSWIATASPGITFTGPASGPTAPGSLTFVVERNPAATPRALIVAVTFSNGPAPSLTITQGGGP